MSESLGSAVLSLQGDANPLKRTVVGARTHTLKEMALTARKSKLIMAGAFLGIAVGVGVGLKKVGDEHRKMLNIIRTETGKTGKELEGLKKSANEALKRTPADAEATATAIGQLNTRLELTGKELEDRSVQFLNLAKITGGDLPRQIELASKAFRDWEVATEDQEATLDGFHRVSQTSGAAIEDLLTNVQKFGSPLRQFGFTLDEAAAMFGEFERSGVNVQTMVPGLKLALGNVLKPTDDLRDSMKKLGVDIDQSPRKVLMDFMGVLNESGNMAEKKSAALDLFGKRAGSDMVEAIQQGRFNLDELIDTFENGTDTVNKNAEATRTFSDRLAMLRDRGIVALEKPALAVVGALETFAEGLITVVDVIDALPGPIKTATIAFGVFFALFALNPYVALITATILLVGIITKNWDAIKARTEAIWNGIKGFFSRFWPVLLAVFTGGLGLAVVAVIRNWDAIRDRTRAIWNGIKAFFSRWWPLILGVFTAGIGPLVVWIIRNWDKIKETTRRAWQRVRDFIVNPVTTAFEAVKTAANDALKFFKGLPRKFRDAGETIAKALGNGIIGFIEKGLSLPLRGTAQFLNKVIEVVSKVPFIDLLDKKVDPKGWGISIPRLARGGVVHAPMAIVGEEAPRHPEFVIPTNPAYRDRARGLLVGAAQQLGMPGFQKGGKIVGASTFGGPGDPGTGYIGYRGDDLRGTKAYAELGMGTFLGGLPYRHPLKISHGDFSVTGLKLDIGRGGADVQGRRTDIDLWHETARAIGLPSVWKGLVGINGASVPGQLQKGGAFDSLKSVLADLKEALPSPSDFLPDWFAPFGEWILKQVNPFVRDEYNSQLATGVGGAAGLGSGDALSPTGQKARHLANRFGLTITSGYRDPQTNATVGGAAGSSHMKGTPQNPGAHDFVPPMGAYGTPGVAGSYALKHLGAMWADIHGGTGIHLHVSWFGKGGILDRLLDGGEELPLEWMQEGGILGGSFGEVLSGIESAGGGEFTGRKPGRLISRLLGLVGQRAKLAKALRPIRRPKLPLPRLKNLPEGIDAEELLRNPDRAAEFANRAGLFTRDFSVADLAGDPRLRRQFEAQWGADHVKRILADFESDDTVPLFGRHAGRNEAEHLHEALNALFSARNAAIERIRQIHEQIAAFKQAINALIKRLRRQLRPRIRNAEALIEQVTGPKGARKRLRDRIKELEKVKPKDRSKRQKEMLRQAKARLEALGSSGSIMEALKERRTKLRDFDRDLVRPPAAHVLAEDSPGRLLIYRDENLETLTTRAEDFRGTLEEIQGRFAPMGKMSRLPAVGTLGGRILDTQMALRDLGEDMRPPVSPVREATTDAVPDPLRIGELIDFSAALQLGAFGREQFAGFFAGGGFIPGGMIGVAGEHGRAELVTGPAQVHSGHDTEQMLAPGRPKRYALTMTNWEEGIGFMEEIADDVVEEHDRASENAHRAGMAV